MIDLTMKLTDVVWSISGKMRADDTVPKSESVPFVLDIDYSDCTLADVLVFASDNRKIAWASTGRKKIGTITAGQHIKIRASKPSFTAPEDPMVVLEARAKAAGRTLVEQFEYERAQRGM